MELDDLIGYGTVGLMKAVDGFDPLRGTLLKTYAEHRIRGAILDGLRGMNWLSRSACRRKAQWQHSSGESCGAAALSNSAAPAAVPALPDHRDEAKSSQPSVPTLLEILCGGWYLEDLEQLSERAGWRQAAGMGSLPEDPEAACLRRERERHICNVVAQLPLRERRLVEMRYQRDMSMKEISEILGVHPSRVSQLHGQAMERLRRSISADFHSMSEIPAARPGETIAA